MDELRQLPVDLVGLVVLCTFLLVSVLLIAAGGSRLPTRWWLGAVTSGLIVAGAALVIVMAVSALDTGVSSGIAMRSWIAIGVAAALGFLAGTDVQAIIGLVRREHGGTATVIAGAVLGPVILIGAAWLLLRA